MSFNSPKKVWAGLVAVSLAALPLTLPASAQTTTPDTTTTTPTYQTENRGFDWGWLGLFGLIGLAGLTGKSESKSNRTSTSYNDPNEVTRPRL
jgi:hypothetical protein